MTRLSDPVLIAGVALTSAVVFTSAVAMVARLVFGIWPAIGWTP